MFENKKPQIDYPRQWEYKLIGENHDAMKQAIEAHLEGRSYFLELSQTSARGKYTSLRLCITVDNQKDRDSIFAAFQNHSEFKMVL